MIINIIKILKSQFIDVFNSFKKWRYNLKEYNHFKNLSMNVEQRLILNKKIVFNIIRNIRNSLDTELFLAHLLAKQGADVKVLLDDGVLPHWDSVYIKKISNIEKIEDYSLNLYKFNLKNYNFKNLNLIFRDLFERNIRKRAIKAYKTKNLEYISYSDIIDLTKINYNRLEKLQNHAESSTIKFFRTSPLDYNKKEINYFYKLSLMNAVLSREVAKYIYNKIKPDYYVSMHGIYSTWAPAFNYLKNKGINCYVFAGGNTHTQKITDVYFADAIAQALSTSEMWKKFKEKPLTEEKKKKVDDYFKHRISGSVVDLNLYFEGKKNTLLVDKNDGFKFHIAMFPNLIWDGNVREKHKVFNGYLDWIFSTINFIKTKKDVKLYVKAHPGELVYCRDTDRIIDLIKNNLDLSNANNIALIPPERKIDTYTFLKSGIDLALVYDGFLGVEIPYLKIPTITCVDGGFSSVKEGNYTVTSKEEYFNYLDDIKSTKKKFFENFEIRKENIMKWIYWYIFDNSITLPTVQYYYKSGTHLLHLKQKDLNLSEKLTKMFL